MAAAAIRSLFSSNRKHLRKSVKLFRNLLEDSRGTFPWNIVERTFEAVVIHSYIQLYTVIHKALRSATG